MSISADGLFLVNTLETMPAHYAEVPSAMELERLLSFRFSSASRLHDLIVGLMASDANQTRRA